jgi:predicted DNA-binding transcriptional regulator AlpA
MRLTEFKDHLSTAARPTAPVADDEVLVSFKHFAAYNIPTFSRIHLRRLMRRGLFPLPVMVSANRQAWRLSELKAWKASRPTAPIVPDAA